MSNISDVQPRPLKDLLAEIHRNDTRLPIFQRDYVWTVAAVKKLLGSVGNGYPIGSILRLSTKNGTAPFGWKLFTSSVQPTSIDSTFKYMILDGQQRLTSLLHAYYGNGKTLYFIDFKKLHSQYMNNSDDIDFEDCIIESSIKMINKNKYNDKTIQQNKWLMPMTYLSTGGFYQWVGEVQPDIPSDYRNIFSTYCAQLTDYPMPVVTLSADISIEAICTIFESLNSSGKQLTPFELVNARLYGESNSQVDLNKKVEDASKDDSRIASNEFSDYALLQIFALLVTHRTGTTSCKKKDVLTKIHVTDIDQYWDKVIEASNFAFDMLKNECGLINIKYLPYKSILVPLIAAIVQMGLPQKKGPTVATIKSKLIQWYWNVVFAQTYETSTDTRGATDFIQLVDWIEKGGKQPDTMNQESITQLVLREYDNPRSGIYKGILCLIISRKAKDFYNGDSVDVLSKIEDHHVFPYAFLAQKYPAEDTSKAAKDRKDPYYNCILNRTLISGQTNNNIKAKSPSNYMGEMQTVFTDSNKLKEILESHLLPYMDLNSYINNDYELFLNQRQDVIMAEIKRVTGFQQQGDIVAGIKRVIGLQ